MMPSVDNHGPYLLSILYDSPHEDFPLEPGQRVLPEPGEFHALIDLNGTKSLTLPQVSHLMSHYVTFWNMLVYDKNKVNQ